MKLGARILKTGIAIVLALSLATFLQLPSPVFAGIAAIFAIQPTIYRSYLSIIEQVQGNLIGALIAVCSVLLFGNHFIIIGLAAIIVIAIHLKLKIENAISLSLVTLIVIMETPSETFVQFSIIRFSTILLGIFSAFVVNLVFLPPKYENKLYNRISDVTEETIKWLRLTTRYIPEHTQLKLKIESLKDSLIKLDQIYMRFKEERNYLKRNDPVKSRKLVIYRQMIYTNRRALESLRRLHRYENELRLLPDDFQLFLQEELDYLVQFHEQTMLKFISKLKTLPSLEYNTHELNRKNLLNKFLAKRTELDDLSFFHAMQVITTIIDYGEQIEHLDVLITSLQSHHRNETELPTEEKEV